jgi:hypothetical protein
MTLPEAHDFTLAVQAGPDGVRYEVEGIVTCPTRGWSVTLEADNEGIIPRPEVAALRLRARAPDSGAEVITDVPVLFEATDDARLERVVIRLGDGVTTPEGDRTIVLIREDVLIAHDFTVEVERNGGDRLDYTVDGLVRCPSTGWKVHLDPAPEGTPPSAERAVFRLSATAPTEHETQVVTETPAHDDGSDDARLEMVEIQLSDGIVAPDGSDTIRLRVRSYS